MALRVRGFVRTGAAIAACTLIAACTPEPPTVVNTPTPSVSTPTASPAPTESEIERQMRLDYEAAESAYRAAVSEVSRLAGRGDVTAATPALKSVATGDYLKFQVDTLTDLTRKGLRIDGTVQVMGVSRDGGWQADRVSLIACEDNSTWRLIDRKGRDVTPQDRPDYIQSLQLIKSAERWKVSDTTSRTIPNVSKSDCAE